MSVNTLFVTHHVNKNLIDLAYAQTSFIFILALLFLFTIFTLQRRQTAKSQDTEGYPEHLSFETGETIKGIAILLLMLGHLSQKCTPGVVPFELTGVGAVIIFLTLSGISLVKTYGMENLGTSFIVKRISRLLLPVWITLALFYTLNYLLLGWTAKPVSVIASFLGIIRTTPPNGPAWFITLIILLYCMFYCVSFLRIPAKGKGMVLVFLSSITLAIIHTTKLREYFGIWETYLLVFPLAVLIGLFINKIFSPIRFFSHFSRILSVGLACASLLLYYCISTSKYANMVEFKMMGLIITSLNVMFFMVAVMIISHLIDISGYWSKFLLTMGKYSFELYLIHMPFMVYYDFFLFRKPLPVFFFSYLAFIFGLSYLLRTAAVQGNKLLSNILGNIAPLYQEYGRKSL